MRRRSGGLTPWIGVIACVVGVRGAQAEPVAAPKAAPLRVAIDTPRDGATVGSSDASVFIAGRVMDADATSTRFDLVLVLDRSKSTDAPTGEDIDGDGFVGRAADGRYADSASDDPGDSVLAAEVIASRTLLAQLDPGTTRVALVAFAGDADPETTDAEVLAPLSGDYRTIQRSLDKLLEKRPSGRTNVSAAIDVAAAELWGLSRFESTPRPDARKIILLMTDGQPTLPEPFSPHANAKAALRSARLAAATDIRVDAFAIGREANRHAEVMQGVAAASGGRFTAVGEPRDLISTFEELRLSELSAVEAHNRTSGRAADVVAIEADGRFSALVPLVPGENRLEIRARAHDGRSSERTLRVAWVESERLSALHPRWLAQRTRLMEQKLAVLKRRQVEIEASRQSLDVIPGASAEEPGQRSLEIHVDQIPAAPEP